MTISLVIPTLRIGDKLEKCIASLEGQYEQLIVVDDQIDNLGKKINKGLEQATCDFIAVSNDDVELAEGSIRDLCKPNAVVSPKVIGGLDKLFHAHFWVMPRRVYNAATGPHKDFSDYKKPGYYEGFEKFYWDDCDYNMKLRNAGFIPEKNESVVVRHDHPGWTLGTFKGNGKAQDHNEQIFVSRWGAEAKALVL